MLKFTENKRRLKVSISLCLGIIFALANCSPALAVDGLMNGKFLTGETDDFVLWLQSYDQANSPYYNDLLFLNKAGNVGIGISAPTKKLDVAGDLLVRNAATFNSSITATSLSGTAGRILAVDASGTFYATSSSIATGLPSPSGISGQTLRSNGTSWVANNLLYNNGTNVGIGTINPSGLLSLTKFLSLNDNQEMLSISHDSAYNLKLYQNFSAGGVMQYNWVQKIAGVDNNVLTFRQGNVGIGTTAPGAILDVRGATNGVLRISTGRNSASDTGSLDFWWSGEPHARISASASGNTSNLHFLVRDGGTTAVEKMRIASNGNVGISTTTPQVTLDVNGLIKMRSSNITTTSDVINKGYLDSALLAYGSSNNFWKLNGSNLYASSTAWNVGIGLTNPTAKLQVNGSLVVDSIRSIRPEAEIAQGCIVSVSGGNLINGGPTYRTQNSYWQITAVGQTMTLNCGGWWHTGMSFSGSNRYNLTGTKMPAGFTVEKSTDGVTWTNVATVTGNAENYYNVNLSDAPRVRITVNAFQSGETQAVISALQLYEMDDFATPNPFGYTGAGHVVHLGNNVGIATTTPQVTLDVNGLIKMRASNITTTSDVINKGYLDSALETLSSSTNALNYWAANGTNIYNKNTGNVGIGTTAPNNNLEVRGASGLRISDPANIYRGILIFGNLNNGWNSGIRAYDSGDAEMRIWHANASGQIVLATGYNGETTTAMPTDGLFIDQNKVGIGYASPAAATGKLVVNGNVGIGTNNPSTVLHTKGYAEIDALGSATFFEGARARFMYGASPTSDAKVAFGSGWGTIDDFVIYTKTSGNFTTNSQRLTVKMDGNVGIGTTTPNQKLEVSGGNIFITDASINSGTPHAAITKTYLDSALETYGSKWILNGSKLYASSTDWNVGIGTTNPLTKLDVAGNSTTDTIYPIISRNTTNTSASGGNVGIKFNLSADADGVNKWVSIESFDTSNWGSNGGLSFTTNNGYTKTKSMVIDHIGNVGIGTNNPGARLETFGQDVSFYSGAGTQNLNVGRNATEKVNIFVQDQYGYFNYVQDESDTSSHNFEFNIQSASTGSADWIFKSRGLETIRFKSGGSVGIGIAAPTKKLDVDGDLLVRNAATFSSSITLSSMINSGNRILMIDNNGVLYSTSSSIATGLPSPSGISGQTLRSNGTSWIANNLLYNNGTNVGIGTTGPSEKLGVAGNIILLDSSATIGGGSQIKFYESGRGNLAAIKAYYKTADWTKSEPYVSSGELQFLTQASDSDLVERMRITSGGNVGIGATTPSAKLTVAGGNIFITDAVITSSTPHAAITKTYLDSALGTLSSDLSASTTASNYWLANGANIYNKNTGNVGIGIPTPLTKLWVQGGTGSFSTSGAGASEINNTTYAIQVGPGSTRDGVANHYNAGIAFNHLMNYSVAGNNGYFNGPQAWIGLRYWDFPGWERSALVFATKPGVNGSGTGADLPIERMVIDPYGSVGIGTTAPNAKLEIKGIATAGGGTIQTLLVNGDTGNGALTINSNSTSNWAYQTYAQGGVAKFEHGIVPATSDFYINSNTQTGSTGASIYIKKADGSVGIRTINPITPLNIMDKWQFNNSGNIIRQDNLYWLDLFGVNVDSLKVYKDIYSTAGVLKTGGTGNNWMMGNLGIGTANPSFNLEVTGTNSTSVIYPLSVTNPNNQAGAGGSVGIKFSASVPSLGGNEALKWSSIESFDVSNYGSNSGLSFTTNNGYTKTKSMVIDHLGSVGINTTAPNADYKLDVAGKINTSGGVAGGFCLSGDCIDSWGDVVGTFNSSTPLTIGNLTVSNIVMDQTGGFGNILNVRKLTVGTIDPLYRIDGTNYSSFAAAIVGGVKEEYLGRVKISELNKNKEYEYRLDFSKLSAPDELWVWRQTVDFSPENVEVNLTPYGAFANIYYIIENEAIIFRADKPVTVSYRLSGKRVDWQNWPTTAKDQQEKPSFIINKGKVIK